MTAFSRLTLLAAALLAGCASRPPAAIPVPAAGPPQVLLLGEVHDNAAGHKLRFAELQRQVAAGWRPVIAMEQFDREQQALLDDAQKGCLDAACVIRLLRNNRWDWQLYYPIIELAISNKLPLLAVNLSRADASRVVRDGLAASFDAATVAAYQLDQPLPADLRQGQERAIQEGHCQMVSGMMLPGMVNAQVARDIWMAKLIRAQQPRDVVLIAGNGHVRSDIGVPRWLDAVAPRLRVQSIGYLEPGPVAGRFDAVRQVAPAQRADPCSKFR